MDPTAVNILQQIIELGTESHGAAVASVVAMAPGTVTVVERVRLLSASSVLSGCILITLKSSHSLDQEDFFVV